MFPWGMVCLKNMSVDTLYKGDTEDNNNNNNNKNNNNNNNNINTIITHLPHYTRSSSI